MTHSIMQAIANHWEFSVFFALMSGFGVYFVRARQQARMAIDDINSKLFIFSETFVAKRQDVVGDFEFEPNTESYEENKENLFRSLVLVRPDIKKGYDLFYVTREKGEVEPRHKHKRSSEIFLLLKGQIVVKEYDEEGDITRVHLLSEKLDTHYVGKGIRHSIHYTQDSEFMVIAHPPLFSRIGNFYGKIQEAITNTLHR